MQGFQITFFTLQDRRHRDEQLQRALRQAIDNGVYGPSSALPAERQLALELGISRITVPT